MGRYWHEVTLHVCSVVKITFNSLPAGGAGPEDGAVICFFLVSWHLDKVGIEPEVHKNSIMDKCYSISAAIFYGDSGEEHIQY